MSSLAFDKHGRSFKFNRLTRRLGVRVFSNPGGRGGCFPVTDDEGEPLYIDADADYLEFRRAVKNEPGLYRLDQCDEDGNEIDGATPAYATIREAGRNGSGLDIADSRDAVIVQLARANAELAQTNSDIAKTAIQNNAALMDAAASLVRAYAAAPPPVPSAPVARKEDEADDDDDEDDEAVHEAVKEPGFMDKLERLLELVQVLPTLVAMFQQMMSKKAPTPEEATGTGKDPAPAAGPTAAPSPGSEATGATAERSASPPSPGTPSAAPSEPPPSAPSEPPPSAPSEPPSPVPPAPEPVTPPQTTPPASPIDPVSTSAAPAANTNASKPTSTPATVAAAPGNPTSATVRNAPPAPPTPTPAQLAHLRAIREQLSPAESALATKVITRMPPHLLTRWLAELSALSVDDATKMVRWIIAQSRPQRDSAQG